MIKKFFTLLFIASVFFIVPSIADAQAAPTCNPITSQNYPTCCPSNLPGMSRACVSYKASLCAATPNDPQCQTIRGGTTPTNPTNTGNTGGGTIAPTPQAGSGALSSCSNISFKSLLDILIWLKCIIGAGIIPLIFTLAFLYFLWGMVMFIKGADDVKKREESKKFIYWGILGLTVMVAIWGIVNIVTTTFGLGNAVPTLQTSDNCLTTDKNNPCKK